jgi:hypothetical protein
MRHYTGNTSDTADNSIGNNYWNMKYSDRNNEDGLRHMIFHLFDPFNPATRTQGMTSSAIWNHGGNTKQSLFGDIGVSIREAGTTYGVGFNYSGGNINYRIAVYGIVGSGVGI